MIRPKMKMFGELILLNGKKFAGKSFGAERSVAGEVVFTTGMTGYPEALTDPSYRGQILVFTYPLIGNYGVPRKAAWESPRVQASGVIVSNYIDTPSHHANRKTLGEWLRQGGIPALEIPDTRLIAETLRAKGTMLGKIILNRKTDFEDPNRRNLVAEVSTTKITTRGRGRKKVVLIDCGTKAGITRELLARGVKVITVPWNCDIFSRGMACDGLIVSNGPGDPKVVPETVAIVKEALRRKLPTLGICLGNQILALAAGGDTYKLKFGHRGQNQPCSLVASEKCYLTTQNHGYAVGRIPPGFREWFKNGNDGTNEGLIHGKHPFMSVQFHPEAAPGPTDTSWIFNHFISRL